MSSALPAMSISKSIGAATARRRQAGFGLFDWFSRARFNTR
jgi:hypothetical protein